MVHFHFIRLCNHLIFGVPLQLLYNQNRYLRSSELCQVRAGAATVELGNNPSFHSRRETFPCLTTFPLLSAPAVEAVQDNVWQCSWDA